MAESVDINLANAESNIDSWSLGCDIIIEEADTDIQEIRLRDIGLVGDVYTGEVAVDINPELANIMDLDVNVTVDGVNPSVVESQIVTYEKIQKITDYSPETTNETHYAASARSAKVLHDSITNVEKRVDTLENADTGLDEEALQEFLDINQYVKKDYVEDLIKLNEMFYWADEAHTIIGTDFNFFSKGEISANGLSFGTDNGSGEPGEDNPSGGGLITSVLGLSAFGTLTEEDNTTTFNAYAIDSLYKRIVDLEGKDLSDYYTKTQANDAISAALLPYIKAEEAEKIYSAIMTVAESALVRDMFDRINAEVADVNVLNSESVYADLVIASNLYDKSKVDEKIDALNKQITVNSDNIAKLLSWFNTDTEDNLYTTFNFYSTKEISANGFGGGGTSGGGSSALSELIDVNISAIEPQDILTYNGTHWVNIASSAFLGNYYAKPDVDNKIASAIASIDFTPYATKGEYENLRSEFDALNNALNEDTEGVINTWNEVVNFVNEYNGSEDLSTILGKMNTDIASRLKSADFETWKTDSFTPLSDKAARIESDLRIVQSVANSALVRDTFDRIYATSVDSDVVDTEAVYTNIVALGSLNLTESYLKPIFSQVDTNKANIAKILSWLAVDADGNLYTTLNFYSTKEISANGLSLGAEGGGLYNRLDSWVNYNAEAGDVLSATLGYALKTSIDGHTSSIATLEGEVKTLQSQSTDVTVLPLLAEGAKIATISVDGNSSDIYAPEIPESLPASDVYEWAKAEVKPSYQFAEIESKPTTLSGYGISDAYTKVQVDEKDAANEAVAMTAFDRDMFDRINACVVDADVMNAESIYADYLLASNIYTKEQVDEKISTLTTQVDTNKLNIEKLLSWFRLEDGVLITPYDFASEKEISANGLSNGNGGNLISSVLGAGSLGTTLGNDNSVVFNAYATNEVYKVAQDNATRISTLETQVNQLAGQSTKVSISDLLSSGSKIATITVDGVAHDIYAPAAGMSFDGASSQFVKGDGSFDSTVYYHAGNLTSLPNPKALKFGSKSYNGSTELTITAADLGALTQHQSLAGYATQSWVNQQEFLTSSSLSGYLKGGDNIEVANGSLYLGSSYGTVYVRDNMQSWPSAWSITKAGAASFASLSVNGSSVLTSADLDGYATTGQLSNYLPLTGGTMSGSIITPANDNMGIIPATNNYGQIGSSDKRFYRMYATTFYGSLSGTASSASSVPWSGVSGKPTKLTDFTNDLDLSSASVNYATSSGSCSGNAATATKLATSRTIWGQSFNGSGNVSGAMTGITTLSASGQASVGSLSSSGNVVVGSYATLSYDSNNSALKVNKPFYSTGEISANGFSSSSDIRFKDKIEDIALDLDTIANAPMFRFTWNNRDDGRVHIGSSAQYWKENARELVSVDNSGFHRLDYSTLGVLMGVTLGKKVKNHEDRIKELEKEITELKDKNRRLRHEC